MVGAVAPAGGFDALLATRDQKGWRGLFHNGKCLGITAFASLGGVLYGYNQGVFSQVQVMAEFENRFNSTLSNSTTKGMLTAILELGAFLGALMAGPLADKYSRKLSISAWCIIFMVGTALQAGATEDVGFVYAGRWFAGMGVGALSTIVPMFNAELAPPGIRGSLVALQQLSITFGILISYWIAYGTNFIGGTTYPGQSSAAWRIPLALQIIPAIILCIGSIWLPYSPRWLMLKDRETECIESLAYLRSKPATSPEVQYEFSALQAERRAEREAARERYGADDVTWRTELLEYKRLLTTKALLRRVFLGAAAQGLGQWTGINAIIYYAPTVFAQIGLSGGTIGLLATGVVGIVNFVMTFPAVLFVDNIGRRPMLCWGELNMAISQAGVAAIIAVYGHDFKTYKAAGNGAVFLIYYYIANYAVAYGPVAWVVVAEVFPLDVRAKGIGISSAVNWIMNFVVATVTPIMLTNIGYKTFLVFMCFCILGFFWAFFILPELKGLSLEEIDAVFHDKDSAEDRERRERITKEIGLDKARAEMEHKETVGEAVVPDELQIKAVEDIVLHCDATDRDNWLTILEWQLQQEEDDETLTKPTSTFPLIRHLMPERDRIANTLFVTKGPQSKEGRAVLRDVYSLCNNDDQVAYRPDEQPVNGVCPCNNCSTVMTECVRSTYTIAANASCEIPEVNNLARTPASFGTESSHLQSTIMHVANGVVVKKTGATIANGILKI
ncbi:hypothetical protein V500_00933 [Pseudogymnoascus sp. VKM F-4518 (FW-2643)]|nr:hypothetical protein V500_00933 [Pseudogymnoascus sp. VKM F-4518 (FW-2643)]